MAIEKRKFAERAPRYPLKQFHDKVVVYTNNKLGQNQSTDFLDISATGIAFVTLKEKTPDMGSILRLTFTIPGKEAKTIKAQVVRIKDYQRPEWYKRYYDEKDKTVEECFVAVNFLNLTEKQIDELSVYLQHLIDSEYEERKVQKITYIKNGFKKSYKWLLISAFSLIALATSLKIYFG